MTHSQDNQDSPIAFLPGMHVHIVGIGGAGMSPIAQVLIGRGCQVSGSDRQSSPALERLMRAGATVFIGHTADQIAGANVVLISSAVPADNPEVEAARRAGIPVLKRREALGALTDGYNVIAVAGTHGKTSTSALIAWLLTASGYDPTYIIGGTLLNTGDNARVGRLTDDQRWFVIEADEYDHMFLGLRPTIGVITNIEHDHPDMFATLEDVYAAFRAFADRIRPDGTVIICADDPGARHIGQLIEADGRSVIWYTSAAVNPDQTCDPNSPGADWLCSPHNQMNLGAVLSVLDRIGVDRDQVLRSVCDFQGVGRRMEKLGVTAHGVIIFSDYGHHPTALKATLQGARRRFPNMIIWAVWQPHTYSRTHLLAREFAESFAAADHALITDIYPAREQPSPGPDPALIAQWARESGHPDVRASGDLIATAKVLAAEADPGDVVIIFSAGDAPAVIGAHLLDQPES